MVRKKKNSPVLPGIYSLSGRPTIKKEITITYTKCCCKENKPVMGAY